MVESGPIKDTDLYKRVQVSLSEMRRVIASAGGLMKKAGDDHIFAIPSSDESRADLEKQGFAVIEIRRQNRS